MIFLETGSNNKTKLVSSQADSLQVGQESKVNIKTEILEWICKIGKKQVQAGWEQSLSAWVEGKAS